MSASVVYIRDYERPAREPTREPDQDNVIALTDTVAWRLRENARLVRAIQANLTAMAMFSPIAISLSFWPRS